MIDAARADKDDVTRCSICGLEPVEDAFPRAVCPRCDARALNDAAAPAAVGPAGKGGDNPVYIDGRQCWRHYGIDGWVTMLDLHNCRDYYEFCKKNGLPYRE